MAARSIAPAGLLLMLVVASPAVAARPLPPRTPAAAAQSLIVQGDVDFDSAITPLDAARSTTAEALLVRAESNRDERVTRSELKLYARGFAGPNRKLSPVEARRMYKRARANFPDVALHPAGQVGFETSPQAARAVLYQADMNFDGKVTGKDGKRGLQPRLVLNKLGARVTLSRLEGHAATYINADTNDNRFVRSEREKLMKPFAMYVPGGADPPGGGAPGSGPGPSPGSGPLTGGDPSNPQSPRAIGGRLFDENNWNVDGNVNGILDGRDSPDAQKILDAMHTTTANREQVIVFIDSFDINPANDIIEPDEQAAIDAAINPPAPPPPPPVGGDGSNPDSPRATAGRLFDEADTETDNFLDERDSAQAQRILSAMGETAATRESLVQWIDATFDTDPADDLLQPAERQRLDEAINP